MGSHETRVHTLLMRRELKTRANLHGHPATQNVMQQVAENDMHHFSVYCFNPNNKLT